MITIGQNERAVSCFIPSRSCLSHTKMPMLHFDYFSFEQQFTETMRMMLQGTKPSQEECHCPRCNRKRYLKLEIVFAS